MSTEVAPEVAPEHETLHQAIHAVQAEATTLQKTELNPAFRSKYIGLDTLHENVLPLVNRHGLTWTTRPGFTYLDGKASPTLIYSLTLASTGENQTGEMLLLLAKQDPQGQGSAITYARRYSLMAVLGLVADEDDDGNAGSNTPPRRQQSAKAKASRTAKAASKAEPVEGQVREETMAKLRAAAKAAGLKTADSLRPTLTEAGLATGKGPGDLTEDQAQWVIVKLRSLAEVEQAPANASE